jgi:hypothetical protein
MIMNTLKTLDRRELARVNGGGVTRLDGDGTEDRFTPTLGTCGVEDDGRDPRTDVFQPGYAKLTV